MSHSHPNNNQTQLWCSDTLHSILGCSDSALASYLTSIASSSSSHKAIVSILTQGNVNPISAKNESEKERIIDQFAKDLFLKCHSHRNSSRNNSRGEKGGGGGGIKKKTNADWIQSAANYDFVNDHDNDDGEGDNADYKIGSNKGEGSIAIVSSTTNSNSKKTASKSNIPLSIPVHEIKRDKEKLKHSHGHGDKDKEKSKDPKQIINNKKRRMDKSKHKRRTTVNSSSSSGSGDDSDNNKYNYNSSEDDDLHANVNIRQKYEYEVQERRMKREKRKRGRDRSSSSSSSSDSKSKAKVKSDDDNLTPEQKAEKERLQDIKERDEFAKRLLEKDQRKTKHDQDMDNNNNNYENNNDKLKKRIEMEQRLARGEEVMDETTGTTITLKSLREESRRVYLKQRTERELQLLEQELKEEEEMFDQETLTDAEKKRIALRKQILQMARDDKGRKDREGDDGFYRLPDEYEEQEGRTKAEKDNTLLKSRYVEEKVEKSEQQLWEEAQVQKAMAGKRVKQGRKQTEQKEYDLIFEQIDFIKTDERKGYDRRKKDKPSKRKSSRSSESDYSDAEVSCCTSRMEEDKPLTEHEKILIGRKKLPVYPYREEFLSAVRDHQVLILVGETGSGKT